MDQDPRRRITVRDAKDYEKRIEDLKSTIEEFRLLIEADTKFWKRQKCDICDRDIVMGEPVVIVDGGSRGLRIWRDMPSDKIRHWCCEIDKEKLLKEKKDKGWDRLEEAFNK